VSSTFDNLETLEKSARAVSTAVLSSVVKAVAMLAAFLLGMHGFAVAYSRSGGGHGLGDYAYKSLQLIIGQFPGELIEGPLPLSLQIARWVLPLIAVWTTISLAWRQLRNPIRAALVRTRGDHVVVAGDAGLAAHLINAERKARRPVLIWTSQSSDPWVLKAADNGVPYVLAKTPTDGATKLGLAKARSLVVAGPDGAANGALVSAAVDAAVALRSDGDPLTVVARIDDPDLRGPLERRFNWTGERSVVRVRIAALPDILAREMFLTLPLDRFQRGVHAGRTVFILGFSSAMEDYVRRVLAAAHFRNGERPKLVVLDADAERHRAVFYARRPGAAALAPIVFDSAPVTQPALIGVAFQRAIAVHGQPTAIFVDTGNANQTLAASLALEDGFAKAGQVTPPIYARLAQHIAVGDLPCEIIPIGGMDHYADPELLLQEKLDELARAVHDFYVEGRLEEGDKIGSRISMYPWDQLPEAVRDDNRLLTDCYELKLRDIGARLVPGSGVASGFRFDNRELEALSRAEHDRWVAAKLIDGWVHGEIRDDTAKHHPDIVSYDALTEARRDLDREQIRVITRLAASAGRQAVRDLTVAIDTPGPRLDRRTLDLISAQYPDRALVILGCFEDASSRTALLAAEDDGVAVALVVSAPPEDTLASIARPERARLRRLYRAADRIYALENLSPMQRAAFTADKADIYLSTTRAVGAGTPIVTVDSHGAVIAAPWIR
jgi:hypothetical protein